mgnify:CR=1 FL=1
MSQDYFISDTHFNDPQTRPFMRTHHKDISTSEMKRLILTNWNNTVGKYDNVWHIGDVGYFSSAQEAADLIGMLNGTKYLVLGNHDFEVEQKFDMSATEWWRSAGFKEVYPVSVLYNPFVILSHRPQEFTNPPMFNIFGHVHMIPTYRTITEVSCCACAERWNIKPVAYDIIEKHRLKVLDMYKKQEYNFFIEDSIDPWNRGE